LVKELLQPGQLPASTTSLQPLGLALTCSSGTFMWSAARWVLDPSRKEEKETKPAFSYPNS